MHLNQYEGDGMMRFRISSVLCIVLFVLISTFIALTAAYSGPAAEPNGSFLAGAASVDITPEPGCILSGYAVKGGRNATGVMHPLHANIVVFSDMQMTAAVVTLDLLNLHLDTVNKIREKTESMTGIPGSHIIFALPIHMPGRLSGRRLQKVPNRSPIRNTWTLLSA